jgi:hypothetical protein
MRQLPSVAAVARSIRVLGVDLGMSWAAIGLAVLEFRSAIWTSVRVLRLSSAPPLSDARVLAGVIDGICRTECISAVSIDGPQGWRDPVAPRSRGFGRLCEVQARTAFKAGPYGIAAPAGCVGWVAFSVSVFDELLRSPSVFLADGPAGGHGDGGYLVLECHPTSTWRESGLRPLPAKRKAPPEVLGTYAERLRAEFGLPAAPAEDHDGLQAVVAALPAAGLLGGPATAVPKGQPSRVLPAGATAPPHRVEGLIWDARPA